MPRRFSPDASSFWTSQVQCVIRLQSKFTLKHCQPNRFREAAHQLAFAGQRPRCRWREGGRFRQKFGVNYRRFVQSAEGAKRSGLESRDAAILPCTARLKACCKFGVTVLKANLSSCSLLMNRLSLHCHTWPGTKPPHPVASLQVGMHCCTSLSSSCSGHDHRRPRRGEDYFPDTCLGSLHESFSADTTDRTWLRQQGTVRQLKEIYQAPVQIKPLVWRAWLQV